MEHTPLREAVEHRLFLEKRLDDLTRNYELEKKQILADLEEARKREEEAIKGLFPAAMRLGRTVLEVKGNPWALTDGIGGTTGKTIADEAIRDLAEGCPRLREGYFGNKRYEGFYQRSDHAYYYGPTFGRIVDYVGLKQPVRQNGLTPWETEAAIYYLNSFKNNQNANK